jgi:hypothetical protein
MFQRFYRSYIIPTTFERSFKCCMGETKIIIYLYPLHTVLLHFNNWLNNPVLIFANWTINYLNSFLTTANDDVRHFKLPTKFFAFECTVASWRHHVSYVCVDMISIRTFAYTVIVNHTHICVRICDVHDMRKHDIRKKMFTRSPVKFSELRLNKYWMRLMHFSPAVP